MQLVESPNRWSCLPSSFATVLRVSLKEFLRLVGHDGSAMAFPALPEPLCRRTFHVQECILAAARLGHSITPLQFRPILTPDGIHMTEIDTDIQYLLKFPGVMTGRGVKHGHAVAWDGNYIYDPSGGIYKLGSSLFTPSALYAVDIQSQMPK